MSFITIVYKTINTIAIMLTINALTFNILKESPLERLELDVTQMSLFSTQSQ